MAVMTRPVAMMRVGAGEMLLSSLSKMWGGNRDIGVGWGRDLRKIQGMGMGISWGIQDYRKKNLKKIKVEDEDYDDDEEEK